MEKLDLKKDLKYLYAPSAKKVEMVDVPPMSFIMIDGAIEPGQAPSTSPLFAENMQAIYNAAYTIKFSLKLRKENPVDYPVMALEGLWWVEDGLFDLQKPGNWKYTVMIMQPDLVASELFAEALVQVRKKKGDQPAFARLRLEPFREGLCVQTMHIGPYATEPETAQKMQAFMQANGFQDLVGLGGKHHEIYMGDPRRADPAKLKTVLRHPVKRI
ncbi:MAG: GyrI-like domain-containing protein [Anaerolineales bacterium]